MLYQRIRAKSTTSNQNHEGRSLLPLAFGWFTLDDTMGRSGSGVTARELSCLSGFAEETHSSSVLVFELEKPQANSGCWSKQNGRISKHTMTGY